MRKLGLNRDRLFSALLAIAETEPVCLLDSCGTEHTGSHLLIAGIRPIKTTEIKGEAVAETLSYFDSGSFGERASIFTISYDLGLRLNGLVSRFSEKGPADEPDVFLAEFETLIVHDYKTGESMITGDGARFDEIEHLLSQDIRATTLERAKADIHTSFTRTDYVTAIDEIKELIRRGDTYQTNLTRKVTVESSNGFSPRAIFKVLCGRHKAAYSAYVDRGDSIVISGSPEQFFRIIGDKISASPIKGTRPRGRDKDADLLLRTELESSEKDRAENTMIVDLLRNDLGKVCEYGTVEVVELCKLEEHPTLFHLTSTIEGTLKAGINFSEILKATFPCGSVTGAPKISTMSIIDRIERTSRGLSMGAIGCRIPAKFGIGELTELSVAIRTMVMSGSTASFNVGGGIVIDSVAEDEFDETVTKSLALLDSMGISEGV